MRLAAAVVLLASARAGAAPLPELYGAPSGTGGFNARVSGAGPAAAYFNPALLPAAGESFALDYFFLGSSLDVDLRERPAGADVGDDIDIAWAPDESGELSPLGARALPTAKLAARQGAGDDDRVTSYLGIGLVKELLGKRLVFGFQAFLPAGDLQSQSSFYSDEREQYFSNSLRHEMYGDRLRLANFSLALASQVTDELALGVGFSAGLATQVSTPVFVPDASDYSTVFLDSDLSVSAELAPHVGVAYSPVAALTLAATLHTPSKVSVEGRNKVRVSTMEVKEQVFTFVSGAEPLTVALAGEWRHGDLALAATALWRQWSDYEDRHGEDPADAWDDTLSAALGARYGLGELAFHLDGTFVPSPVPAQTGRSNYVDSTRLGGAFGVELSTSLWGHPLRGSLGLQVHRLLSRSVSKDPDAANPVLDEFPDDAVDPLNEDVPLAQAQGFQSNNPGYPGYSSSGWLLGAGFTLETPF